MRGPQIMKGYFNNPLATEAVLKNGWLFTGDMARRDAEGYYTIVDRKKDIIKTSGYLVFPAEVEEVLRGYPDVAEAAVVGVPDHDRGEVVKALIVPRSGCKLDLAALESHCKAASGQAETAAPNRSGRRVAQEFSRQGAAPQTARIATIDQRQRKKDLTTESQRTQRKTQKRKTKASGN